MSPISSKNISTSSCSKIATASSLAASILFANKSRGNSNSNYYFHRDEGKSYYSQFVRQEVYKAKLSSLYSVLLKDNKKQRQLKQQTTTVSSPSIREGEGDAGGSSANAAPYDTSANAEVETKKVPVEFVNNVGARLRNTQHLRRGVATAALEKLVEHRPPGEIITDAINLLPTNEQVQNANLEQLANISGDEVSFEPYPSAVFLTGSWTKTVIVEVKNVASFDYKRILTDLWVHIRSCCSAEEEVTDVVEEISTVQGEGQPLSSRKNIRRVLSPVNGSVFYIRQADVLFYPVFSDAYALRVRLPAWLSEAEKEQVHDRVARIAEFFNSNSACLAAQLAIIDVVPNGDGLHTNWDERRIGQLREASNFNKTMKLKIGAKVMLRANLTSSLVNGSVGIVVRFVPSKRENISSYLLPQGSQNDVAFEQYNDYHKFELGIEEPLLPVVRFGHREETIPPHAFLVGGYADTHYYAGAIVSLPLSLAYAFTIHKVQGLTLVGRIHIELSRMWECHHLLYVAMSRVKNPEQLSMSAFEARLVKVAEDCLVFDDSLPTVAGANVCAEFIPALWKTAGAGRKRHFSARRTPLGNRVGGFPLVTTQTKSDELEKEERKQEQEGISRFAAAAHLC